MTQPTSQAMSQGHFLAVRNRDALSLERKYRRAIILIRAVILQDVPAVAQNQTANIPAANLAANLGALLGNAYAHEERLLAAQYLALRTNPVSFLTNNKINMVATPGVSGRLGYAFFYDWVRRRYEFVPPTNVVAGEIFVNNVHIGPGARRNAPSRPAHQWCVTARTQSDLVS